MAEMLKACFTWIHFRCRFSCCPVHHIYMIWNGFFRYFSFFIGIRYVYVHGCVIFSMFLSWNISFYFVFSCVFGFSCVFSSLLLSILSLFPFFICSCCCLPCGKNIVLSNRKPLKTSHLIRECAYVDCLHLWFWCCFRFFLLFLFNLAVFFGVMVVMVILCIWQHPFCNNLCWNMRGIGLSERKNIPDQ